MLTALSIPIAYAANSALSIKSETYNSKTHALVVHTAIKDSVIGNLFLLHGQGGVLSSQAIKSATQTFSVPLSSMNQVPCSVVVMSDSLTASKNVTGAPTDCTKVPVCQIISPKGNIKTQVGIPLSFTGKATLKDKKAGPLKLEWDFGGGAMGHPTTATASNISFIRNNSNYRVRFTATDAQKRHCEASVDVEVGLSPVAKAATDLLSKASMQAAPTRGNELAGTKNDVVVLPVEEWSFQCINDHFNQPNINTVFPWAINNLGAAVYRKDRLPLLLDSTAITLKYLAATNPLDPVSSRSINSTSQNWPLGAFVRDATIAKTDLWERVDRRGEKNLASDYESRFWIWQYTGGMFGYPKTSPVLDEGMLKEDLNPGHGRYMPGIAHPYEANDPQDFSGFTSDRNQFTARWIPITDVDDQGQINPFPLMRVQVMDNSTKQVVATTDAVMTTGRDLHCRECHAKGKIAADPNVPWTKTAYHSSLLGEDCVKYPNPSKDNGDGMGGCIPVTPDAWSKPQFIDAKDNTFQEQEWAALNNIEILHDFYDYAGVHAFEHIMSDDGLRHDDGSFACDGCHASTIRSWPASTKENIFDFWTEYFAFEKYGDQTSKYYAKSATVSYHGMHALFQKKTDGSLMREANGKPTMWNPTKGKNPNSLFPVIDAVGNSLPMEQNCLRCHSGQREQCYRDRMYTSGTTCYDCHGDMQAMGLLHKKPEKLKTTDGNNYRIAWYEEPDCGSCHTGNANEGKDGNNGFFSAGILRRAFASDDLSATSIKPKSERFAVLPIIRHEFPQDRANQGYDPTLPLKLTTALYRDGKDTHGDVPCASCHGGAHAVWPNRDANANDNVTAIQLQGHTGTVLECNVCHTANAFKIESDLDGGRFSGDVKAGILGGPHNTHPINDPYWWKSSTGDSLNADGTIYGGLHNNYAKKSGKDNEDQCAACHGNDHKGTRLSKTPVDRVFDFSDFNIARLKKVGFKSNIVKVAAGTMIGCDTCHSIKLSCNNSPAGNQCGKP